MRRLAAGNWKMNGDGAALAEIEALARARPEPGVDVWIAPPATLIHRAAQLAGPVVVGGQDAHPEPSGAHTGDVSAPMLREAGARFVILGHSERRQDHEEDDALVRAKARAAIEAGLVALVCVGEAEAERRAGGTLGVVGRQLAGSVPDGATAGTLVVAYEPVWAIGTGRTPTLDQIREVHAHLRERLVARFGEEGRGVRLLYGGSVKPDNAAAIFAVAEVNGALVGGASLQAAEFGAIVEALERA